MWNKLNNVGSLQLPVSLQQMQCTKALLIAREQTKSKFVTDEELLLIAAAESCKLKNARRTRPCDRYHKYGHFHMSKYTDEEFRAFFHFEKRDFPTLARLLRLEEEYVHTTRITWGKLEGLAILLRRLAYPNRLVDLTMLFGRDEPELSAIINTMICDIITKHKFRLDSIFQPWFDAYAFARVVYARSAAMPNI